MPDSVVRRLFFIIGALSLLPATLFAWTSPHVFAAGQATSRGGEKSPYVNFDGVWDTGSGPLILAQEESSARGIYNYGLGRIDGTVTDNKLEFEWIEIDGSGSETARGPGEFTMRADRKSFDGLWGNDKTDMSNEWDSVYQGPRDVSGVRPELEYCLWRGSWSLPDGAVMLEQEMDSSAVEGEFITRDERATITGNAVGWGLEFSWAGGGTGSLEMKTDMSGFTGNIRTGPGTSAWDGTFHSGESRDDFSGEWRTSIGQMNLTADSISGVVRGGISGAEMDGAQGDLDIDGIAIGNYCSFDWTGTLGGASSNGSGALRILDEGTLEGSLWRTGEEAKTAPTAFTARIRPGK
jgi:hypothetical protein